MAASEEETDQLLLRIQGRHKTKKKETAKGWAGQKGRTSAQDETVARTESPVKKVPVKYGLIEAIEEAVDEDWDE